MYVIVSQLPVMMSAGSRLPSSRACWAEQYAFVSAVDESLGLHGIIISGTATVSKLMPATLQKSCTCLIFEWPASGCSRHGQAHQLERVSESRSPVLCGDYVWDLNVLVGFFEASDSECLRIKMVKPVVHCRFCAFSISREQM